MGRNRRSAKKAGASFESAVARYLNASFGGDWVERRHLTGSKDRGDIAGVHFNGDRVVIECKNTHQSDLSEHLKEAETEATNDGAEYYALVQKRHGVGIDHLGGVGQQYVIMPLSMYAKMLGGKEI